MAFSHSTNARSKSRSPAPQTGFQPKFARTFFPPSHYAAAAGLPYPNDRASSSETGDSRNTLLPSSSISTAPDPGSQPSFKPTLASQSSYSGTASFGSNVAVNNRQSVSKRRQSQLGDLPMLEAQLVPSLRDTINRMTMPPPRTSVIELSSRPPFLDLPNQSDRVPPQSDQQTRSVGGPFSRQPVGLSLSPAIPPLAPRFTSTPKARPATQSTSTPSTSIPVEQTTSQQKLKSVLKSYLRPPTPKLSTQANASRSMVADLKKGVGMASYARAPSPNVNHKITPTPIKSEPRVEEPVRCKSRTRSRTDPGTALNIPPPATPTMVHPSRLPRRNEPLQRKRAEPDSEDEHSSTPGSSNNNRRKLFVANASIAASSSSESEPQPHTPVGKASKLPRPREQVWIQSPDQDHGFAEPHGRFGLGFGLGEYGSKLRGIFTESTNRVEQECEDGFSACEESASSESRDEHLAGAAFSSESSSLVWGNDNRDSRDEQGADQSNYSGRSSYNTEEPPDIHRKRREALLGIVQDLDSGVRSKPQPSRASRASRASSASEDSDYVYQGSLSISNSGHLEDFARNDNGNDYLDDANHRHSQLIYAQGCNTLRTRDGQWRDSAASRSPLPTFKVSSEEDYHTQDRSHRRQRRSPAPEQNKISRSAQSTPQPSWNNHAPADQAQWKDSKRCSVWDERSASPSKSPRKRGAAVERSPIVQTSDYQGYRRSTSPLPVEDCDRRVSEREQHTPRQTHEMPEVSSVAESFYAAATRQRKAFGIPRPISDYYTDSIHEVASEERLPHADSDLSSVGDDLWREDCDGISAEAERLFTELEVGGSNTEDSRRERRSVAEDRVRHYEDQRRPRSALSQLSDTSSVYDDPVLIPSTSQDVRDSPDSVSRQEDRAWRSTLSQAAYCALLEQHGEVEMQRQQVIWELFRSEEIFVGHLHCVIRLFVQPLRVQKSRTWIAGVPLEVTRLFDWLEDIVNLHSHILDALHSARKSSHPMICRAAEMWEIFVPRLEVYQPYLVRLEEMAALIEQLMMDEDSDFGEFVNIQEGSPECQGWSLERFLIEPVNRLAQYPELFRRLLGVTPRCHTDYLSTFSVLHSINMIIRVMSEVKFREDEYDVIKDIISRIHGLPLQLVKRERRLLNKGTLRRMPSSTHPRVPDLAGPSEGAPRSSRLISAINDWGMRRHISGSSKSTTSTAMSFLSLETASCASASLTFDKSTIIPPQYRTSDALMFDGVHSRPPGSADDIFDAFVFTDLLVLAAPTARRISNDSQTWRLVEGFGISRILDVMEDSETSDGSFMLDLITMDPRELETGLMKPTTTAISLRLTLLNDITSNHSLEDCRRRLLSKLRQSAQLTIRSLSCLSHSEGLRDCGLEVDLDNDTHRSVMAIMSSGLPLPKSPSVQLGEVALGEIINPRQQEREERGWWSLRFQQVLNEMQRREALIIPMLENEGISNRIL